MTTQFIPSENILEKVGRELRRKYADDPSVSVRVDSHPLSVSLGQSTLFVSLDENRKNTERGTFLGFVFCYIDGDDYMPFLINTIEKYKLQQRLGL